MKKNNYFIRTLVLMASIGMVSTAFSQSIPDAGKLMQEAEPVIPLENNKIPKIPPGVKAPAILDGVSMPVENFYFNGHSIVTDSELHQKVQSWLGKKLVLEELKHVTDLVAELYRDKGYLARVFLPEQNIHDGSVLVEIIEARFGHVSIDSSTGLLAENPDLLEGLLMERQQSGELFNLHDIERASLLINDLPGVSAKAVLAASEKEGHTDLNVSVQETNRQTSYLSYDNYGSRSSGESRLIYSTNYADPLHRGDLLSANAMLSEGNIYAKTGYELPLGYNGLRLGASLSLLKYQLGGEFEALDAEGSASNLTLTANYPLIRQTRQNLRLTGNILLRDYTNEQLGIETSDKSVIAFNVGVSGDRLDSYKGGGVFYYSVSLTLGDLDLSGNATNLFLDKFSAQTDGNYTKIDWNISRLQTINEVMNLWVSARGQFVDDNVDSSETISLGGSNGVRAYPALEISGDDGLILTTELRYKLRRNWSIKGFYDFGQVTQKSTLGASSATHDIQGIGVGVDWEDPKRMITARAVLAHRIGDNPLRDPVTGDDTDGSKNLYPVWLNLTKHF